jgi:hypothetical protein
MLYKLIRIKKYLYSLKFVVIYTEILSQGKCKKLIDFFNGLSAVQIFGPCIFKNMSQLGMCFIIYN